MKSKQLANVLFKVLGFSVCLYAIPSCVAGILLATEEKGALASELLLRTFSYTIGYGVQAAVGIVIIAQSKKISGWLFKNDDE